MPKEWKPQTDDEMDAATDFEGNAALRNEVEADAVRFVNGIAESVPCVVNGVAMELEPGVVKGLVEAEEENNAEK